MEGDAQLDACTLALLVIVQQVDGVTSKQQRDIFAYVLRPVGLQWKAVVERLTGSNPNRRIFSAALRNLAIASWTGSPVIFPLM